MIPKLILSRPKLKFDIKCPKCKSYDIAAMAHIPVTCSNCKTKFSVEPEINIYHTVAKKLISLESNFDEFVIEGERNDSEIFYTQDMLKPRNKYEDDIYHTILAIRRDYLRQGCWDVSEITADYDADFKVSCCDCGYCLNCVTCSKCGNRYEPKLVKNQKRYTCPKCKDKRNKPTTIKFKIKEGKRTCPFCGSENLKLRKINAKNKTCPNCGSKNITIARKLPIYKLVVKRQERYLLKYIKEV